MEPTAVELTKKDYEKRMGIKSYGGEDAQDKDVNSAVGENPASEVGTSVHASRTRQEAIKALRKKGHEWNDLKTKTKAELNALL